MTKWPAQRETNELALPYHLGSTVGGYRRAGYSNSFSYVGYSGGQIVAVESREWADEVESLDRLAALRVGKYFPVKKITLLTKVGRVTELRPDDTADNPFWYIFKVQCTSCREIHPNFVNVSRFEANDMSGSRGEANFVWKCKSCKRESTATIKAPPIPYTQASPPTRQKILEFDCRGLEFVEYRPEGDWLATGLESGTKFAEIDLTEGEWFDYDDKAGEEASIKDIKWEISRN
ncbi:hypothetical protein B7494_g2316 [Chlorociboria aeruginascens]|nr:hypothetical protein B7494_g2316 [Chlorociboria aeruginascens]